MKFGEQLRASLIKEYYHHYIDYDYLKRILKTRLYPAGHSILDPSTFTDDDERDFVRALEAELDKVHSFQAVKSSEIVRRIKVAEKDVEDLTQRLERRDGATAVTEDEFDDMEGGLGDIMADVHDLAKFTRLNYTGFQKILKKHDKLTGRILKPMYQARLNAKAFYHENYDQFIVKISQLYDLVRTRGDPIRGDSGAGGNQQNFVRQTTKYWVHDENITELKLVILKHLPVLVFNPNKPFDEDDMAITSIYYDNDKFDLYEGRLKKTEGAEAIRLRWYGGMGSDQIFVERKTHREDWTGEKSVKARFSLKEKHVNAFMSGEYTVEQAFEKMRRDKKKPIEEIEQLERLAREIQYTVITKKLKPKTRSFYNRLAFQLPGDARVRISLDTQLTMTREDGPHRAGNNWRRTDIGIDWPFKQLPANDIVRFPYAVLEVKLQTHVGQEPPDWIRELVASHLVEAVPKFSKFIHGSAVLFPQIKLWPYWLPQMGVDIKKPPTHDFGIDRRIQGSGTTSEDTFSSDEEVDDDVDEGTVVVHEQPNGHNGSAGGGNHMDEEEAIAHPQPTYTTPDTYVYDSEDEESQSGVVGRLKTKVKDAVSSITSALHVQRNTVVPPTTDGAPTEVTFSRIKAPPGKKIFVPVRVEPKVYFAGERTFLSWLEFAIYIGAIATTLINFGDKLSVYAGITFTVVSVSTLLYSVGLYIRRSQKIRKRAAISYHDKFGPTVLCGMLFISVVVTFFYRWSELVE